MEMPAMFKAELLARLGQGALVGAVATMIIGFNWGGWVLGQSDAPDDAHVARAAAPKEGETAVTCPLASRPAPSIVEEAPEHPGLARMLQLAQRLGLDLADTLTGQRELLADFLQRVVAVHADAEAHA